MKGKNYKRTDFTIINPRDHKLHCSFWEPYDEEREYERLPCVVYLHGNSSSRAEALSEAKYLLPMNVCLLAFDFSGCGKSEGEYISLGWYERDDVECVIQFLRRTVYSINIE
jgi:alpha/beta superfamily hydrolase